jgi:hypothetical protein
VLWPTILKGEAGWKHGNGKGLVSFAYLPGGTDLKLNEAEVLPYVKANDPISLEAAKAAILAQRGEAAEQAAAAAEKKQKKEQKEQKQKEAAQAAKQARQANGSGSSDGGAGLQPAVPQTPSKRPNDNGNDVSPADEPPAKKARAEAEGLSALEITVDKLSRYLNQYTIMLELGHRRSGTDTDFENTAGSYGADVLEQVTAELALLEEKREAAWGPCEQGDEHQLAAIATIDGKVAELAQGQFKLWRSCFALLPPDCADRIELSKKLQLVAPSLNHKGLCTLVEDTTATAADADAPPKGFMAATSAAFGFLKQALDVVKESD